MYLLEVAIWGDPDSALAKRGQPRIRSLGLSIIPLFIGPRISLNLHPTFL